MPTNNITFHTEIALSDAKFFLLAHWKRLIFSMFVGAILGVIYWFTFGTYRAEFFLINTYNGEKNSYTLTEATFRDLQKKIPILANKLISSNQLSYTNKIQLEKVASFEWWKNNVSFDYLVQTNKLNKPEVSDEKPDLRLNSYITFVITEKSKMKIFDSTRFVKNFFLSSAAYIEIEDLINYYKIFYSENSTNLLLQISKLDLEISYIGKRIDGLEKLNNKSSSILNSKTIEFSSRESEQKILQPRNLLINAYSELNLMKEKRLRLMDAFNNLVVIKSFLDAAIPLLNQEYDGFVLFRRLSEIASRGYSALEKSASQEIAINEIDDKLKKINIRYSEALVYDEASIFFGKSELIKTILWGVLGSFFSISGIFSF